MRFNVSAAFVAVTFASLVSCERLHAVPPALSVAPSFPIAGRCQFNRVLASPAGAVAVYRSSTGALLGPGQPDVAIGGERLLLLHPKSRPQELTTPRESLEVVGWLRDGGLMVRVAKQALYKVGSSAVEPMTTRIEPTARLEPSALIQDPSLLGNVTTEDGIRTVVFSGLPGGNTAQVNHHEGALVVEGGGSKPRLAIGLSDVRMFIDDAGRNQWTFSGDEALSETGPYSLPVIDQRTGKKVGTFGPRQLSLSDKAAQTSFLKSLPADAAIVDFSTAGKIAAALFENGDGSRSAVISRPSGITTITTLCTEPWHKSVPKSKLDSVELPSVNERAHPPVALLRRSISNPQKCLNIYFHGGPDLSMRQEGFSGTFLRLKGSQCDLLTVEYSGSTGGGFKLSNQVRELGFRAFEADAASLRVWVASRDYQDINLLGVSFGAAPALVAKDAFGAAAKLFLLIPMTSVRAGAERSVSIDDVGGPSLLGLLAGRRMSAFNAFLTTFFGGQTEAARFDAALERYYALHGNGARIYAGRVDQKVPIQDLMRLAPRADLRVYPGSHEVVGGMQAVWSDIAHAMVGASATAAK